MSTEQVLLGIDENGLGPILGPLLVTGVAASVSEAGAALVTKRTRGGLRARLGDSKRIVAFGDTAQGEAWARALFASLGHEAATPSDLLSLALLDGPRAFRALCPRDHHHQCWSAEAEAFLAPEAMVKKARKDIERLARRGIVLSWVRSVVVCTKQLNEESRRGVSRFDTDLHAMERLILAARDASPDRMQVTCGKVGGYNRYDERFRLLDQHLRATVHESRARSTYTLPHIGDISFVRDAEDAHMLVALASLVGKYFRDLFMARVVRYHRAEQPELPEVSGYHDPITRRFIAASALVRKSRAHPDDCFARIKVVVETPEKREKPDKKEPPRAGKAKVAAKATRAASGSPQRSRGARPRAD